MRNFHKLPFLALLILTTCPSCEDGSGFYNRAYYEKWSGIIIPKNATILESADNGETVTITIFEMDTVTMSQFIEKNNFVSVRENRIRLFGSSLLKSPVPVNLGDSNLVYKSGVNQKWGWLYLINKKQGKLFAEIQYPDPGGD